MNRREFIGGAAATLMTGMAFAGLELGAPFADHAVLQRGMEVPVWGTAVPGGRVKVEFAGASVDATVGADGKWRLKLYFAQLAPFKMSWSGLAQAQTKFAEEEPNAVIAVTADVGNPDDLHPNEKETVARRLALHALKRDYGFDIPEDDSPVFRSAEFRGDLAVLKFDHVKTWYVYNRDFTFGVPFELAGADGVWKPARLVDCGEGFLGAPELHMRSEGVGHPVAVRYMGGERAVGVLYN